MVGDAQFAGDEWRGRVGNSWAVEWERTDRSFAGLTGPLVDAIGTALPERYGRDATGTGRAFDKSEWRTVLDIGCGAGETALRLAAQRGDLAVTGLDLSDELIAVARQRAVVRDGAGPNSAGRGPLDFVVGDAAMWTGRTSFDGAFSRHGVMFFTDPVAAFAHVRTLMAPAAPLIFSCFAEREANVWAHDLMALIGTGAPSDPFAPGPFAFADPGHVASILGAAGWRRARQERVAFDYVAGAGPDPVSDAMAFFERIGPAARALAKLDRAEALAWRPQLTEWIARHVKDGTVRFPAAAWLWRAMA